jgi:hypothetical protein
MQVPEVFIAMQQYGATDVSHIRVWPRYRERSGLPFHYYIRREMRGALVRRSEQ